MKYIRKALDEAKLPFVEVSVSNASENINGSAKFGGEKKVDVILVSPSNVVVLAPAPL